MTEDEVRVRLRRLVSPHNPADVYAMGAKIGKGASGVVYVARVHNSSKKVAIKTMVLSKQPRKVTSPRLAATLTPCRTCFCRRSR